MLILIIGLLTAPMTEPPVATEIRMIEFTPVHKKRKVK
jgi:hypothetical protein